MNTWFRMYHEVLDDPKVQNLPADTFKVWVNMLCLAARNEGALPLLADVSFAFRMTLQETEKHVSLLVKSGLIDRSKRGILHPHNWDSRQFKSDNSTARVKRFRQRFKTVTETVNETPPDSEQTQNRTEQSRPDPYIAYGEFGWARLTAEQYEKLTERLNGKLPGFIERFDNWVNEAPDAKKDGIRRRDRHAYESIISWSQKDESRGTYGQRESAEEGKVRRNIEAAKRVLARTDPETRSIF